MGLNERIVSKAGTISTAGLESGLLNPEQARKFIQQTFPPGFRSSASITAQ